MIEVFKKAERYALVPVGALALLVLMVGVVVDVAGRNLLNSPLRLMHPLAVEVLMPIVAFLPLMGLALAQGHVRIAFLISKMAPASQRLLGRIYALLSALFWGGIAWAAGMRGLEHLAKGAPPSLVWRVHPAVAYLIISFGAGVAALLYAAFVLGARDRNPELDR